MEIYDFFLSKQAVYLSVFDGCYQSASLGLLLINCSYNICKPRPSFSHNNELLSRLFDYCI